MKDYIKFIRGKVGHECIFLNFSAACIRNSKGEILLQNRGDNRGWGFPGGALEIGESYDEAVVREVREETGIEINVKRLIGIYSKYMDKYSNGDEAQTILAFFECDIKNEGNGLYDRDETKELKFFEINKTPKMFNKQHQDMMNDLKKCLAYTSYR